MANGKVIEAYVYIHIYIYMRLYICMYVVRSGQLTLWFGQRSRSGSHQPSGLLEEAKMRICPSLDDEDDEVELSNFFIGVASLVRSTTSAEFIGCGWACRRVVEFVFLPPFRVVLVVSRDTAMLDPGTVETLLKITLYLL